MKAAKLCPTLCDPKDYTVHGILQARILQWVAVSFFTGSSQPRDQTQVSHIAGGFFTSWATREALKNPGMGSLSLLQQIFPTQESNRGLMHCRRISLPADLLRIIRDCYKKLYANKMDNLEEMDKFLVKFNLPILNQEEI